MQAALSFLLGCLGFLSLITSLQKTLYNRHPPAGSRCLQFVCICYQSFLTTSVHLWNKSFSPYPPQSTKRVPTTYSFAWLNLDFLNLSAHSGVVLSVEEVEAGLKGLKVDQQVKNSTPFMAEHLEETLSTVASNRQLKKDGDMTAFNKLVSTMKASGTLPSQPKVSVSIWHRPQPFLLFSLSIPRPIQ